MFLYAEDELGEGAFVDGWVVEARVARGAMAAVYRARHASSGERAALKVLLRRHLHDPVALARFALERDALSRVLHPAVVGCVGGGELADGLPFLALEWLEGQTLAQRVEQRGPLSLPEATAVMKTVCEAVDATHRAGLVHRDLKAENLFYLEGGGVKLLDFGIARQTGPDSAGLTSTGHVLGSPVALAPEQIRGEPPTPATDVYALGVLAHVILAGRPPFEAARLIDLEALHLSAPRPPLSSRVSVPAALDAVVARCLERDAASRYTSTRELWETWERAVSPAAEVLGVGVLVRLDVDADADDETLEALEQLERGAATALSNAGFQLVVESALLLGCRVADGERAQLEERWRTFARELRARLSSQGGTRVSLGVHVSPVRVEGGAVVEGEVLSPPAWPPSSRVG